MFFLLHYSIVCIFFFFFSSIFFFNVAQFYSWQHCGIHISLVLILLSLIFPCQLQSHFCWEFERSDFWDEFARLLLCYQIKHASVLHLCSSCFSFLQSSSWVLIQLQVTLFQWDLMVVLIWFPFSFPVKKEKVFSDQLPVGAGASVHSLPSSRLLTLKRLLDWQDIFSFCFSHCHSINLFRIHAKLIILQFLNLPFYIFLNTAY